MGEIFHPVWLSPQTIHAAGDITGGETSWECPAKEDTGGGESCQKGLCIICEDKLTSFYMEIICLIHWERERERKNLTSFLEDCELLNKFFFTNTCISAKKWRTIVLDPI